MSQSPESKAYRALAEECDRLVALASNRGTKIKLREMAQDLRKLEIQAALSKRS
jgi:hypothetical protein